MLGVQPQAQAQEAVPELRVMVQVVAAVWLGFAREVGVGVGVVGD